MGRYITLHSCLYNSYDGPLKWVYYCAKKSKFTFYFKSKLRTRAFLTKIRPTFGDTCSYHITTTSMNFAKHIHSVQTKDFPVCCSRVENL